MTREEQIREAAKKTTGLFSYRNGYSTAEDAFVAGAEWADANQPAPWISVEDKLPELDKEVIILDKGKHIDIDFLMDDGEGGYFWWKSDESICCEDDEITHWMPLPELPKEG